MHDCLRFPLVLSFAAFTAVTFAVPANAVDYGKFPSFHYYDVEKENGAQTEPAIIQPIEINSARTGAEDVRKDVFVLEQELRDFLLLAGKRNNARISVSPSVRGTIRNLALPSDIDAMLDMLAREFDFEWFRESGTIQVSSAKDSVSRVIFLGRMRMEDLETSITEAGLTGEGYDLSFVESSNSVVVKGPVALIAKIELIAEAFNKKNSGVRIIKRGKEG
jgi:type II secretory pathway component GspD/PulD (secretin)